MEELINRLRQYSQSLVAYKLGADFSDAVCKAADTLESHTYERSAMIAEIENLQEELSQVKAERDAAVEDLRNLAHEHCTCYACINDKFDYDKSCCTGCPYNNWNNWQWRGPKKEA